MRTLSFFAAVFAAVLSTGVGVSDAKRAAPVVQTAAMESAKKAEEMKVILFNLVRQDERLDAMIDRLGAGRVKLSAGEITAIGAALRNARRVVDLVSARNKKYFSEAKPDLGLAVYTRTIYSYSGSISRKTAKVGSLLSNAALKYKKNAMRDAVSSANGKNAKSGARLTRLLEEKKALAKISADALALKTSARRLKATSKWLHLVYR